MNKSLKINGINKREKIKNYTQAVNCRGEAKPIKSCQMHEFLYKVLCKNNYTDKLITVITV